MGLDHCETQYRPGSGIEPWPENGELSYDHVVTEFNDSIGRPVEHPHATTVLLLGVPSIFCCGITGPVAWMLGKRALNEIELSGGALSGRFQVLAGYIAGIAGTILMILTAIFILFASLH